MTSPEKLARRAQQALFAKEPNGRYEVVVTAKADGSAKARVQIYGVIGDWWDGLDAATLADQINALDAGEIEVHLNSPGGIAFDGIAIYNALRQHDADVHIIVDGLAASAASIIAMAGDTITMAVGSQLMVHDASGLCYGQAADMAKTAEVLDKISDSIADTYAQHTGGTRDEWRQVMLAETWYTADEAVDAGLADAVDKAPEDGAAPKATASFDLSIFAYAGREKAPAPHMPPAEPVDHHPSTEGAGAMPNIPTGGLSERLGVPAEASEETILAALDEALAERAEPTTSTTLPAGVVAIDQTQLDQLQADAAQGRAARQEQLATAREDKIRVALADGRITAASASKWRESLEHDDKHGANHSADLLASLAKNAVPMEAIGYTGGKDESNDDDTEAIYAKVWPTDKTKEA